MGGLELGLLFAYISPCDFTIVRSTCSIHSPLHARFPPPTVVQVALGIFDPYTVIMTVLISVHSSTRQPF